MSRRPRWGRCMPAALLLGAGAAALAPGGPQALAPFKVSMAAAASDVYVAVVIDFGPGGPASIVQCVKVPAGATDAQALGVVVNNQVSYASSGLLCAIDDYPSNGLANCDASQGSLYYFWAYWHGASGAWQYANDGPATHPVTQGDVEGWSFQDPGPASPNATTPAAAPDYSAICPASLTTPTTTTTTTVAPTTPTTVPPGANGPSPSGAPGGGAAPGGTPGPTAAGGGTASVPAVHPTTTTAPTTTSTTTAPPPATVGTTTPRSEDTKATRQAQALAAARARSGSGDDAAPFVIGAVIVASLGLGAFIARRRRPDTS